MVIVVQNRLHKQRSNLGQGCVSFFATASLPLFQGPLLRVRVLFAFKKFGFMAYQPL